MIHMTHKSYREIEKLYKEGKITKQAAVEVHKQHNIISEACNETEQASRKMMKAIGIINDLESSASAAISKKKA